MVESSWMQQRHSKEKAGVEPIYRHDPQQPSLKKAGRIAKPTLGPAGGIDHDEAADDEKDIDTERSRPQLVQCGAAREGRVARYLLRHVGYRHNPCGKSAEYLEERELGGLRHWRFGQI